MRHGNIASISVLAVAMAAGLAVACKAPSDAGQASTTAARTGDAAKNWTPTRTAWGDPDLQGVWENLTPVPLERAKEFGTREFMTEQEAAERLRRAKTQSTSTSGTPAPALPRGEADEISGTLPEVDKARNSTADRLSDDTPGKRIVDAEYNAFWNAAIKGPKPSLRTSQIVDPPDGRLPSYTQEALAAWDAREKARLGRGQADTWEDRGLGERCIAQPVGNGVFMGGNHDIEQAPGYVVIHWFTPGDGVYRIVPMDGRPHAGSGIRQWYGDARGRWEGNTLVVETTNFNDQQAGEILPAHGGLFGTGHSHNFAGTGETLRLIERFTRIDADTLEYRTTIEDPKVFVRPWTAVTTWTRDDTLTPEYEYACHEHNYGMVNALRGARANEKDSLDEAARELKLRQRGVQQKWSQLKEWQATQGKGAAR